MCRRRNKLSGTVWYTKGFTCFIGNYNLRISKPLGTLKIRFVKSARGGGDKTMSSIVMSMITVSGSLKGNYGLQHIALYFSDNTLHHHSYNLYAF